MDMVSLNINFLNSFNNRKRTFTIKTGLLRTLLILLKSVSAAFTKSTFIYSNLCREFSDSRSQFTLCDQLTKPYLAPF